MSTAVSTALSNPRQRKTEAVYLGFLAWTSQDQADIATSRAFSWGTGAPNHTAAAGSMYWRVDASTWSTHLYRNTDGATTWEAIGAATMSGGTFQAGNGTVSAPSWSFANSTGLGFYRITDNQLGIAVAGALDFSVTANSFNVLTGSNADFADSCKAMFGDADDVTMAWDGTDFDILGLADDQLINIGNGTNDFDLKWFGNIATSYIYFDASADEVRLVGPIRPTSFNALSRRYELKWVAGQRGKPGLNADIQNAAEATRMIADPDFEVLGVNATSGSTAFGAEGGITLTTAGADGDEVILLPHLDASQSAWAQVTWGTDQQTEWECHVKTGANITNAIIWCGLKLTNTEVTATDNDQVFFRYEDDVNTGKWQAIESIGGTDTATDSAVTVAVSTSYHLKIAIDSSRVARFYINGVLVRTSSALTNATDLIPYIGVAADGAAAAKVITVYGQSISRTMA